MQTGSTVKEMHVEICSQCHPLYTGKKKVVDATGRVDRFKKMTERADAKKEALKKAAADKKEKVEKAKAKVKKTTARKAPAKKKK